MRPSAESRDEIRDSWPTRANCKWLPHWSLCTLRTHIHTRSAIDLEGIRRSTAHGRTPTRSRVPRARDRESRDRDSSRRRERRASRLPVPRMGPVCGVRPAGALSGVWASPWRALRPAACRVPAVRRSRGCSQKRRSRFTIIDHYTDHYTTVKGTQGARRTRRVTAHGTLPHAAHRRRQDSTESARP